VSADTPQDSDLEQLLTDTAELRRQYRAASQEEPPIQLDETIRAAARRQMGARPGGSRWGVSWHVPASIAAVVVVSVTLAVMVGRREAQPPVAREQRAAAPAPRSEVARDQADAGSASGVLKEKSGPTAAEPAAQPLPHSGGAPASLEAPPASAVQKVGRPVASEGKEGKSSVGPAGAELGAEAAHVAAPAAPPAAAAPAAATEANSTQGQSQEGAAKAKAEERVSAQPLARKRAQARPAETDSIASPWEKDPQAWLAHIEELRATGRNEDAAVSFRGFRNRYPDYQLPAGFVAPGP